MVYWAKFIVPQYRFYLQITSIWYACSWKFVVYPCSQALCKVLTITRLLFLARHHPHLYQSQKLWNLHQISCWFLHFGFLNSVGIRIRVMSLILMRDFNSLLPRKITRFGLLHSQLKYTAVEKTYRCRLTI